MIRLPKSLFVLAGIAMGFALLSIYLSIPQLHADRQYKQGVGELAQGQYAQARRSFQNAVDRQREQPAFYAAHALATVRAAPGLVLPHEPWTNLPALTTAEDVLLREAADDYRRALSLSGNDAAFWSNLGWVEASLHQDAAAREAFERAVIVEPSDVASRVGLGLCDERAGRADAALEQYAQALAASPRILDSAFFRDLKGRNPSGAALVVNRCLDVLRALPPSPIARASIAKVLEYQGRQEEARQELTATLQELPDLSYAWANLGSIELANGNTAAAQVDFQRALDLYSWNRFAANKLAAIAYSRGEAETARNLYIRTLLTPLLSIHANRSTRVYHVAWTDTDDLAPPGLLEYLSPPIEPLEICGPLWDDLLRTWGRFAWSRRRIAWQKVICSAETNAPAKGSK